MCFEPQHNNLHFFDISTSRCALTKKSFQNFDFEMCLAPQRRAIFDSHPTRWLRTRRYSEPTFRHCRATKQWTQTAFRDFSTSSRILNFFLLALFSLTLLFSVLLCTDSLSLSPSLSLFLLWLFSQLLRVCPQVGTLTSKFLSVTHGLSYCWITFIILGEPKTPVYMHGFPKQTEMALLSFIIKIIVFTSVINIRLYLHNYHIRSINFGLKRSPWQLEMMHFQAAALQNIPAWM